MSSKQYYYLIAGLPKIGIDDGKVQISVHEFIQTLEPHLSASDMDLFMILRLEYDIENILISMYKKDNQPYTEGFLSPDLWAELISWLKSHLDSPADKPGGEFIKVPSFVVQELRNALVAEETPPELDLRHHLIKGLSKYAEASSNSFIRDWYSFNRMLRNILVAINGRNHDLDYAKWLIGDDEVTANLAKSRAADFNLGKEVELLNELIRAYEQNNVLYREKSYDVIRWKWIDRHNFFEYFSIDKLMGYFCQLCMLSRWLRMDVNEGKEVFFDVLNEMQNSFSFPIEFAIKNKNK